uniref:Serpin domain-containing protein n=1 Tax=Leptobrachium leishanense TaxID=445787 RepID=A0A8C5R2Z6_9ANUR
MNCHLYFKFTLAQRGTSLVTKTMKILVVVSLLIPLALGSESECSYQDQQSGQCQNPQNPGGKNKLGKAESEFALNLYREVTAVGPKTTWTKNVHISPISVFYPFVLLLQGSGVGSQTYNQISKVLRLNGFQNDDQINERMRLLINQLNFQGVVSEAHMGSKIFLGERTMLTQSFHQIMDKYYKTDFQPSIFIEPAQVAEEINEYISKATKKKIPALVDNLKSNPNMVLASYLYFKGEWEKPFNRRETREETFNLINGEEIKVSVMHNKAIYRTYRDETLQCNVIQIPYKGSISLIVAVPTHPGDIHRLGQGLTIDSFQQWLRSMSSSLVELALPKFSVSGKVDLKGHLEQMGMHNVFNDADFTRMSAIPDISLTEIFHQTVLDVSESGAQASGATAAIAVTTARTTPFPFHTFNAKTPFLYYLYDKNTETLLLTGKITDPTDSD